MYLLSNARKLYDQLEVAELVMTSELHRHVQASADGNSDVKLFAWVK